MSGNKILGLHSAHVAIVGLGLMGGSLALALRPHVQRLTAVEVDAATRRMALEADVVDDAVAEIGEEIGAVDLLVLALPVGGILNMLEQLPGTLSRECVVMDLGSTKGQICAAMNDLPPRFSAIGGHPMCGKESSGLHHAQEDLYRDQTFILCRTRRTNETSLRLARAMLDLIGAKPLFLQAQVHDRLVAQVSHLPYLLAALLMQQSTEQAVSEERMWQVSASGFRDTSRLAGSEPAMIGDIVETNHAEIVRALRRHASLVEALLEILSGEANTDLDTWLRARQNEYLAYRAARRDGR